MYGNVVKQSSKAIPYLSTKIGEWTADKVLSTNDDGS
jgi:hypothetical protein